MSQRINRAGGPGRQPGLPPSRIAPIFAALGDTTRLQIIHRLSTGESLSISELTEGTAITRQAITKHLEVLAQSGLVHDKKVGRERRWQAKPQALEQARQSLDEIAAQWDDALAKLKAHVEE